MKSYLKSIFIVFAFVSCGIKPKHSPLNTDLNRDEIKPEKISSSKTKETTCIDVVFEIINSNPQCMEMLENLKKSDVRYGYFVRASPNPQRDLADSFSKDFEIVLFESHPEYNHNFAFYKFSPETNKLYKMDIIEAEFAEVDFDVRLISQFQQICSN